MSEWISVKDRLPEIGDDVLVWEKWSTVPFVGWLDPHNEWRANKEFVECNGNAIVVSCIQQDMVTHWMPLPPPPTQEQSK